MAWGTCTFNQNGGTGGQSGTLYFNYTSTGGLFIINYWSTSQSTSTSYRISSVSVPNKSGYVFAGYFDQDGRIVTSEYGSLSYTSPTSASRTATAKWINAYKITLNPNNGTSARSYLYYKIVGGGFYLDEALSVPVSSVTVPTYGAREFQGYVLNGVILIGKNGRLTSAASGISISSDVTATAAWEKLIDDCDFFGLGSDDGPLMLVESNSGAKRSVTATAGTVGSGTSLKSGHLAIQTKDSSTGAFEDSGVTINPTCKYKVRKSGNVTIPIGKAFGKATITGTGASSNPYRATESGYMLTEAEYSTGSDAEPILVVRGTANEGYVWSGSSMRSQLTDAINLWSVVLAVNPDHIAQDPMGAVSGGGELTSCKTIVTCEPVVPTERGMPCASDVVKGKVVVAAQTSAYFGEGQPTAAGQFVDTSGVNTEDVDGDFTTYSFNAERSL